MTSLSKLQGRTVNYGSVRTDQNSAKTTTDKRVILQDQSTKITQIANFEMYPCSLCSDFSVSQSIDESMWGVHGTYCISLGSFYTPQGRITVHLSEVKILISFGDCVYNILRHGTLDILQLRHLGICMYTMETHTGLIEYPYTLHIEEARARAHLGLREGRVLSAQGHTQFVKCH